LQSEVLERGFKAFAESRLHKALKKVRAKAHTKQSAGTKNWQNRSANTTAEVKRADSSTYHSNRRTELSSRSTPEPKVPEPKPPRTLPEQQAPVRVPFCRPELFHRGRLEQAKAAPAALDLRMIAPLNQRSCAPPKSHRSSPEPNKCNLGEIEKEKTPVCMPVQRPELFRLSKPAEEGSELLMSLQRMPSVERAKSPHSVVSARRSDLLRPSQSAHNPARQQGRPALIVVPPGQSHAAKAVAQKQSEVVRISLNSNEPGRAATPKKEAADSVHAASKGQSLVGHRFQLSGKSTSGPSNGENECKNCQDHALSPTSEVPRKLELRERRESEEGHKQAQHLSGPHRLPELFRLDVEALEASSVQPVPVRTPFRRPELFTNCRSTSTLQIP